VLESGTGSQASNCCAWQCCDGSSCWRIGKTTETECNCTTASIDGGVAEEDICNTVEVRVPEALAPEEDPWVNSILVWVSGGLIWFWLCYMPPDVWNARLESNQMSANFDVWRSKCLRVKYFPGGEHGPPEIRVQLPTRASRGPQPVVVGSHTGHAVIPPGAHSPIAVQV